MCSLSEMRFQIEVGFEFGSVSKVWFGFCLGFKLCLGRDTLQDAVTITVTFKGLQFLQLLIQWFEERTAFRRDAEAKWSGVSFKVYHT